MIFFLENIIWISRVLGQVNLGSSLFLSSIYLPQSRMDYAPNANYEVQKTFINIRTTSKVGMSFVNDQQKCRIIAGMSQLAPSFFLLATIAIASLCGLIDASGEGQRIIGGEPAAPGEFPYQIFIENVVNTTEILKCGGALYSNNYVITAAHCMFFRETGVWANPKRVWITMGTNDLEEGSNAPSGDINKYKKIARVSEIIAHPNFAYKKFEGDKGTIPTFDIALLRLSAPVELNERTKPIPLAPKNYVYSGLGTVTGWGRQDPYGKWTKQLRKADIPLVEWEECARLFKGYATVTKDMFCTGTKEGGMTPCNGDSGGPVACRDDNGEYVLCGIASFGPNRCPNYSVYTRVPSYVDWVEEEVRKRE